MLLRKQESYIETFYAKLQFNPSGMGYESRITVYWSIFSYATIGILGREMSTGELVPTVEMRRPTGGIGKIEEPQTRIAGNDNSSATLEIAGEVELG
ncbi:hypothetical protein BDV96DRAFT_380262 [Lophiotrema nucula]|uniref:Uncharacterized protein n=1 Tax=Lophiotrema nucula TaxID=690887 RepID=A0A6A5ZH38_9PLEO|nr:hypothetical protein BDV96DRAFT_380262 [Lophiotrema nucula]